MSLPIIKARLEVLKTEDKLHYEWVKSYGGSLILKNLKEDKEEVESFLIRDIGKEIVDKISFNLFSPAEFNHEKFLIIHKEKIEQTEEYRKFKEKFQTEISESEFKRAERWISQFPFFEWKLYALKLLTNIIFLNEDEINKRLKTISNSLPFLKNCVISDIVGVESSEHLFYLLNKLTEIPKKNFIHSESLTASDGRDIVFIDNLIGTGNQAKKYIDKLKKEGRIGNQKLYYFAIVGLREGIRELKKSGIFEKVLTTVEIQNKAFDSGYIFTAEESGMAKEMASELGEQLTKDMNGVDPLGYKNSEALVFFGHNTPNNSLPIFWASGKCKLLEKVGESIEIKWTPLFPRKVKPRSPELILIEESIHTASICDQPANQDALGFKPYVEAIADFLTNPDTIPPLTLSIEGQWGCGKSSFMLQLKEILTENKKIIVEFNAWRHDTEESMWAAFAIEFMRQISFSQSIFQRFKSYISLNFQRFSWKNNTFDLLRFLTIWFSFLLVTFAIIFLYLSKGFQWSNSFSQGFFADSSLSQNALKWLISLGSGAGLLGLIISAILKLKNIAGSPFEFDFNKYFKSPDYENRVTFIETFHNDFKNIVNAYAGDNKIYIFIDDLDRCEIPKAAELMQGLNLMISDNPHLVFIIGLDREKVAASFAVKHEKLLPYLSRNSNDQIRGLEYGYAFIEKFIQLPFSIPQPGKLEIQDLLKTVSTNDNRKEKNPLQTNNIIGKIFQKIKNQDSVDWSISKQPPLREIKEETHGEKTIKDENEKSRERIRFKITGDSQTIQDIGLMVAPALDYNPRRIKQFLNLFRLRTYIASATGLFDFRKDDDECLTLEQLGKFVAISLRWPLLLADLDANRQLLAELQDKALGKNVNPLSDSAKYWGTQQKLLDLLRSGCLKDDNSPSSEKEQKCSLSKMNLDKLLQVSPRVIRLKEDLNANINDSHQKADEIINNPVNSSYEKFIDDDEIYRQSLEMIPKTLGQDNPDATSFNNLAEIYREQGKYEEAELMYKRELEIREKALGSGHPDVAASLNNLGSLYQAQGKFANAAPLYHRAIEIAEKSLGEEHPDFLKYLKNYENFLKKISTKPRELAKIQTRINSIENKLNKEKHK